MPIRLNIEAETVEEFDALLERFMPDYEAAESPAPAATGDSPAPAKPAKRGRGKKTEAAAPTQNPDGTPIAPVHTPEPQPTPGGTDAPPAESIPPNQPDPGIPAGQAAQDPFAQNTETVAATPAATSPADQAAAAEGEVTVQNLKDKMAELLKAKSAAFAMETLFNATGCKSLTSGSPNVVEKAKEDPTIMRRALDALHAGITAA